MPAKNGDHGYGFVTKLLHWLTFVVLVAQLTLGYLIDDSGHGRGRGRGRGGESGRGRGRGGDGGLDLDDPVVRAHVILGCTILALAVLRLAWRLLTPLPPWSERLGPRDRWVENALERVLILMLFATPVTGLLLLGGEDDLVALHVACHVVLYVAFALHVALVLRRGTFTRMVT